MTKKPDCLSCGACCVSLYDQSAFCDVEAKDIERLGAQWVRHNVLMSSLMDRVMMAIDGEEDLHGAIRTKWVTQRSGPLKGVDVCTCVALRGSLMKSVKCSVYEKRPDTCRTAVVPGDRTCIEIRRMLRDLIERELSE